jgi:hypothetical protein
MGGEFARLYGHSLVSFARQESGCGAWDRLRVNADGSFHLELLDPFEPLIPVPEPSPAFLAVISALRAGRIRLLADGDDSLGFAEGFVPLGLLRGDWCVYTATKGRDPLFSVDPWGNQVGPTYFRPRLAPPAAEGSNKKPGYNMTQPALSDAMAKYKKELSAIPTQDGKAKFLAKKVGCHKNSAITFLKGLEE